MTSSELTSIAVSNPSLVLAHFATKENKPINPTTPSMNFENVPDKSGEVEKKAVGVGASSEDVLNSYRSHAIKQG